MDNTTNNKAAPLDGTASTPRLKYIKAEAIRVIHSGEFLDFILILTILFDGIVIGRAL